MAEHDQIIESHLELKPDIFIKATDDGVVKEVEPKKFVVEVEFEDYVYEVEIDEDIKCVPSTNTIKNEDKSVTFSDDEFKCERPSVRSDSETKHLIKEEQSETDDKTAIQRNICLDPIDVKEDYDCADSTLKCAHCKIKFESIEDSDNHIQNCNINMKRYDGGNSCETSPDIPQVELGTMGDSDEHRIIHTGEKQCNCEKCTNASLIVQDVKFQCKICSKRFKNNYNLKMHQSTVHRCERPYSCEKCSHKAKTKTHLISHRGTHNDVKKYQCDICFKRFKTQLYLKRHRVNYHDEAPYRCHQCSYETNRHRNLRKHRDIVHEEIGKYSDEKLHNCSKCPYRANTKHEVLVHENIHSKARCDVCLKEFNCKRYLINHRVIHTEEKPYGCEKCSYKAKRKGQLAVHMRTHDKEKKFKCDICTKKFKSEQLLNSHRVIHSDEGSWYVCDKCSYKTKEKAYLIRHSHVHD